MSSNVSSISNIIVASTMTTRQCNYTSQTVHEREQKVETLKVERFATMDRSYKFDQFSSPIESCFASLPQNTKYKEFRTNLKDDLQLYGTTPAFI